MEHVPNDYADLVGQAIACRAHDTDFLVRVPRGSYSDLVRPLELGATGIMIPHVRSAEEARQLVGQVRFMPLGRRALDGGNADAGYASASIVDYIRHANEQTLVILQIEDPEAMEDLEAICEIPGYDMLFFGPGDFAHALGHVGELTHPDVVAARRKLARLARKHGRLLGTVGHGNLRDLLEEGYRFLNLGADVLALRQYYADTLENFRGLQAAYKANEEGTR